MRRQTYEEYAAGLDENLWEVSKRLKSGRNRAPAIGRCTSRRRTESSGVRHPGNRNSSGAAGGGLGPLGRFRARLRGMLAGIPTKAQCAHAATAFAAWNAATLGHGTSAYSV